MENENKPKLSREQQEQLVTEIVEMANKSNAFYGTENDRKKDDARVFSNVEVFNQKQKKEMGDGRLETSVNPLPLYINAVSNLFLENPFQADADTNEPEEMTDEAGNVLGNSKEYVNEQLQQILENSDANNSVFGPGLRDLTEMGGAFFYLTTDENQIKVNLAYDPTSCIFDPDSKTIDGRDASFFGIVETVSYDRANEMTGGTLPVKDRLTETKTYNFAGYRSGPDSLNLLHFFRKEGQDVAYYQIVGDIVVKHEVFVTLSCLPVVPVYGQSFRDNNKKLYKGVVRDVKDLCKIVNGAYSVLWERIKDAQDPFWLLDQGGVENTVTDYESESVKYKRFRSKVEVREGVIMEYKVPTRVVPEIVTADIMPQINDALQKISKIIGVPEDGIGFTNGAVQQTAAEYLGKSTALVNNVSHYYRNLQQSIKHLCEVIVEMVCIYNGLENTFTVNVTKGPADALKRERSRQQLSAILQLCPDAVKPLVLAELVKLQDLPNADAIAAAILVALPAEIKQAMGGKQDPAILAQQLQAAQQQVAQLTAERDQMAKQIQADVISNQAQLIMSRENNEAALRSKLVEIEARAAENEKDRALEMAKLDASQQAAYMDAAQKSREADIKARDVAVKELEAAQKLRQEAEAKRAEMVKGIVEAMPAPVEVQPVAVV